MHNLLRLKAEITFDQLMQWQFSRSNLDRAVSSLLVHCQRWHTKHIDHNELFLKMLQVKVIYRIFERK